MSFGGSLALNIYLSGTSLQTTDDKGFGSLIEQFAWYGIHDLHQRHPFLLPTHQPVVAELKNIESIFEIFQEAFEGNHISAKALCYNLHVECIGLILIAEGLGQSRDSSKPTAIPDKYITEAVLRYKERLAMAFKIRLKTALFISPHLFP